MLAVLCLPQAGSPLPAMPKGAAITLSTNLDLQQSNAVHYKSTDETAKFEQVSSRCWASLRLVAGPAGGFPPSQPVTGAGYQGMHAQLADAHASRVLSLGVWQAATFLFVGATLPGLQCTGC
jgi:hypothetical protein